MNAMALVLLLCAADPPIVLKGGTVLPMNGSPAVPDAVVVIRGEAIEAVRPAEGFEPPADARVVDARGGFVIPGLIDAHVHLMGPDLLEMFLVNGVTTIREMGNDEEMVFGAREDVAAGRKSGPRIVCVGPLLDGEPPIWPFSRVVTTPEQAEKAVAALAEKKVDQIKVYSRLLPDPYAAILKAAKARGLKVVGHIPRGMNAREAAAAGQDGLEHLYGMVEAVQGLVVGKEKPTTVEDLIDVHRRWGGELDAEECDALARFLAERKVTVCPTLTVLDRIPRLGDPRLRRDPDLKFVPAWVKAYWEGSGREGGRVDAPEAGLAAVRRGMHGFVARLQKAGVRVIAGTDTPNAWLIPGFSLHEELKNFVAAGWTPEEALAAATRVPAEFLGLQDRIGTVEAGRVADLVVLDRDPRVDIEATRAPRVVVARGKLWDRERIAARLKEFEQEAAADAAAATPPAATTTATEPWTLEGKPVGEVFLTRKFSAFPAGEERCAFARREDGALVVRSETKSSFPAPTVKRYDLLLAPALRTLRLTQKVRSQETVVTFEVKDGKLRITKGTETREEEGAPVGFSEESIGLDAAMLLELGLKPGESRKVGIAQVQAPAFTVKTEPTTWKRLPDEGLDLPIGSFPARVYTVEGAEGFRLWTDQRGLPIRFEVKARGGVFSVQATRVR